MREILARVRVPLGFAVAAAVLYLATPTARSLAWGLPVAALGLLFRAAAAGVIQKDRVLARSGPYRLTRNPLYFGSFLLAAGFGVMSGHPGAAALLLAPSLAIYPAVIRREEAHLERCFGAEFHEFRRHTPGFLPRRIDRRLFESFDRRQYLRNREYNAALGFAGATAILVLKAAL